MKHHVIVSFGRNREYEFKVKGDGGKVDALSGATVTSRGVAVAVTEAAKIYGKLKPQLAEKTRAIK